MRNFLIILVCILMFGCRKDNYDSQTDHTLFVPLLHSSNVISHTSNSFTFNLDISLCDSNSVYALDTSDIHFYNGTGYSYELLGDSTIHANENQNFCTALLVDQSGSYLYDDFDNDRFKAFNGFYKNIKQGDSLILATFSKGGQIENDICTINWEDFASSYEETKVRSLLDLCTKTGGESCLLDALYIMTNYMYEHGSGSNRSIVAFVHNKDNVSQHSISEVVANALAKNIKINIIWLGYSNFDRNQLIQIPAQTGGFSTYCDATLYAMSVFLCLDKLLHNNYECTRYKIRFNTTGGGIGPGYIFTHALGITGFEMLCFFFLQV